ncbi:glutamate-5-semialdehyde dehydrogenase [Gorillibacterium timonense]|uniref:glutamate-5-semialdehyde dehydrogenase n=1 Tax=Gorillibacterium timonense TaxID=1689269 RepID=UPI00071CACEE|nr:glutamate-5-semialdehyde dehydrogenase [Gorillibacterium timonense]
MSEVQAKAQAAKQTTTALNMLTSAQKNKALSLMAEELLIRKDELIQANRTDIEKGAASGLSTAFIDRLTLTDKRIEAMAEGLRQIIELEDPIGDLLEEIERPNGLLIRKVRVPLGLIGIIYESRPNVTVDAAGLCLKSGNAVLLRGGSDALASNLKLVELLRDALSKSDVPVEALQLIESPDRASVNEMLTLKGVLDVLIPRGGHSLIRNVVENATVPVIETGAGICHTYLDDGADPKKALDLAYNAKVQRPSVCNSMETLLVNREFAVSHLRPIAEKFLSAGVELRCCPETLDLIGDLTNTKEVTELDFATEYNDYILNVRIVNSLDEAIAHINRYGTQHSECIVTENADRARKFMLEVDAAAVYQNASTRFTDGFEFGFGAEIGISTQKLHARGPMGLPALTTTKYCVYGNGQIRE